MTRASTAKRRKKYFAEGGVTSNAAARSVSYNAGIVRNAINNVVLQFRNRYAKTNAAFSRSLRRPTQAQDLTAISVVSPNDVNTGLRLENELNKRSLLKLEQMVNKIKVTATTKSEAELVVAATAATANRLEVAPTPEMSRIDSQMGALREEANRLIKIDVLTKQEKLLKARIDQQVQQLALRRQAITIAQLVFGHQSVLASMDTIITMVTETLSSLNTARPTQLTTLSNFQTSQSAQSAALAPALAASAAADANVAIGNIIDALYILRADMTDLSSREAAIRAKMEAGITKINALNTEAGLRIEDILNNRRFYADYTTYLAGLNANLGGLESSLSDAETQI
jgi:hypothetical protein